MHKMLPNVTLTVDLMPTMASGASPQACGFAFLMLNTKEFSVCDRRLRRDRILDNFL